MRVFVMKRTCLLSCFLALLLPLLSRQEEHSKLLLVSFDGFRWDYVDRVPTPNFHALMEEGVQVEKVENTYITKTLPNHYTLVTGLHAESHGVVANEMYDPVLNRSFSMEGPEVYDSRWWEEAVPLWVTTQKAGRRSGAAMWPGSDVAIRGIYPTHYVPYNASMPFEMRVEKLISWFLGTEAIDFGVLYWEEPDETGHNVGPESPLMDVVIEDIDRKLGFLREKLKISGLYDKINLIVTSDHGMTQLSRNKIIELDAYVSQDLYTWIDKSPVVGILPKEGKFEEVYNSLENANPNMVVYKKEDIPDYFHYKHNARIMPIIIEAKEGWTIVKNRTEPFMMGNHGYDNHLRSMHPVFVARGPSFRTGYTKTAMRSVDLYPLMCYILGVQPLPNNGSLASVRNLLAEKPTPRPTLPSVPNDPSYAWALGLFLGAALVVGFLVPFVKQVTQRQLPPLPLSNQEISQPLLQEDHKVALIHVPVKHGLSAKSNQYYWCHA
ncbi:ectonucleotide pyrophosphatase/phosphodiesterase family member 5-like [Astyanax mexicanus]|uniref:ectonucleotide pyrophosphatase/phosphodiesterase family member 5-like n=1 Tax=Astyanax mexicanus TaxID=7994 RepID=UPI0020CAEF2B|nr:ectonucleotide pyrophosphatase/phosphodiesterase family member 5-like [Astyanax mexicanus]XP_049338475.1 ectonucleotide pyrophosphatase/phosphodiesterase family member 5-like [Astyanax mexicanus]